LPRPEVALAPALRSPPSRGNTKGRVGAPPSRRPGAGQIPAPPLHRAPPRPHHPKPAPRTHRVMRPVATSFAGVVPAPIEKVFALLADPARIPHWLPGCRSANLNGPGPLRKGSRLTVLFGRRAPTLELIKFSHRT